MNKKVVKRFSGINIFLTTVAAESFFDNVITVQTGFIYSDARFTHVSMF